MEVSDHEQLDPDEDLEELVEDAAPRLFHYSTGRLTAAQAQTVNAWRARLRLDKPLPGIKPKPGSLRALGIDDRPPCSCSDVIAATVRRLLDRRPPEPLDVVRYHYRAVQAQKAAGQGDHSPEAPVLQPVSFYLSEDVADEWEALRDSCATALHRHTRALYAAVAEEITNIDPDTGEIRPDRLVERLREASVVMRLAAQGLPHRPINITAGVIGRMAIDAAARRKVDLVVLEGVAWASEVHQVPQRGRKDMYDLTRKK